MGLHVYNTLTGQRESFEPIEPGRVRMYVCGVTVYGPAHIGHGLMAIVFDVIRRYLAWSGYEVEHVQNFTDVDDKIIAQAHVLGLEPLDLAQTYIDEWERDMVALNIVRPTVEARATLEIGDMIAMVEGLVAGGYAYPAGGDVYFRVRRFEGYGKLSKRSLDELKSGARVEVGELKEDPLDFALWKAAKPGEIFWDSPWGPGRPGWHIECSAMSLHHLGGQIDIHGGGADLIFPHHENEIAQSEAYTGRRPFARYWIHNGLLQLSGDKMSKSLGNLITIRELLESHPDNGQVFRFMVLTGHYRRPLTWSDESFESARRGLDRLRSFVRDVEPADSSSLDAGTLAGDIATAERDFRDAMDDDFNTSAALAALFELGRGINQAHDRAMPPDDIRAAQQKLVMLAGVLGLKLLDKTIEPAALAAAPFIDLLLQTRDELRRAKHFALSDRIRDRLTDLGIEIADSSAGTTWRAAR